MMNDERGWEANQILISNLPYLCNLETVWWISSQKLVLLDIPLHAREDGSSMSAYEVIYTIVQQIPNGQVATYGQIAALANLAGKARLVGYALYRVTDQMDVPWHRVVNAQGQISQSLQRYGSDAIQRSRLEAEGIPFDQADRINLAQHQWQPSRAPGVAEVV